LLIANGNPTGAALRATRPAENGVAKQGSKKVPKKKHSFRQALIAVQQEDVMSRNDTNKIGSELRMVLPVILRITFCLALWTLGARTMTVVEAQTREHRAVRDLPVDHTRVESLQRWVNAGHDAWCRDAKSVAAMTASRIVPEFAHYDFELASLVGDDGKASARKAVYTFHSIDGRTSYRITLRRFGWQNKTASSPDARIWIPVRTETITRDSLD
jgi:hypothetical protein